MSKEIFGDKIRCIDSRSLANMYCVYSFLVSWAEHDDSIFYDDLQPLFRNNRAGPGNFTIRLEQLGLVQKLKVYRESRTKIELVFRDKERLRRAKNEIATEAEKRGLQLKEVTIVRQVEVTPEYVTNLDKITQQLALNGARFREGAR